MSSADSLSPDQRAVLQLLLKQGKRYDELAGLLRIDERAVRDRAVSALEALGPQDGVPPPPDRRAEIADYLLGQQTASQRASTRSFLEGSAAGRGWARVVGAELRPLAGGELPDVPAEGAEVDEAFDALQARTVRRQEVERSSRIGGALLLAGVGIVLAVVLILVFSGGDDEKEGDNRASTSATTATTATTSTGAQPTIEGQVNLTAPQGTGSKALGVANILSQDGQRALAIQAQGLQRSTNKSAYAVWLLKDGAAPRRLGFAPPVAANGRLQAVAGLPENANTYKTLIVSRETTNAPKRPGTVVLSGALQLPAQQAAGG